jgi:hypothetical protein
MLQDSADGTMYDDDVSFGWMGSTLVVFAEQLAIKHGEFCHRCGLVSPLGEWVLLLSICVRNEARGIERGEREREAGARPGAVSYSREAGSIERVQRSRVDGRGGALISSGLKKPTKSVRYLEFEKVKAKVKV